MKSNAWVLIVAAFVGGCVACATLVAIIQAGKSSARIVALEDGHADLQRDVEVLQRDLSIVQDQIAANVESKALKWRSVASYTSSDRGQHFFAIENTKFRIRYEILGEKNLGRKLYFIVTNSVGQPVIEHTWTPALSTTETIETTTRIGRHRLQVLGDDVQWRVIIEEPPDFQR